MVQNYKHVIQFHYKQKVHNHGYLDSKPRCILDWKIYLGLNIDFFV
jgi:hypothetical protein